MTRLAKLLKELDLTEGRGTGIPKVLRAMKENGSPPQEFRSDEGHSLFVTVLPIHPVAKPAPGDLRGDLAGPTGQVTGQVARLLQHLDGEVTRQDVQDAVGVASRAHFRTAYLDPALEAGLIEMAEPTRQALGRSEEANVNHLP